MLLAGRALCCPASEADSGAQEQIAHGMVVALSKDKKSPGSMSDLLSRGESIQPASQGTGAMAFADAQAIVETIHQPLVVWTRVFGSWPLTRHSI
jgi:hypothetical protein